MKPKPVCLIILDGWGHRENAKDNAIAEAKTPFFDLLMKEYPHTFLNASQEAVGLPKNTIGNSEIGHMTIGAGRVIDTDLMKIDKAAKEGEFISNPAFTQLFDHVKKFNSVLHVLGLVSPAGVHSHRDHLYAFLKAAKSAGVKKLAVHAFTDGRDSPPKSAGNYLKELEDVLDEIQIGFVRLRPNDPQLATEKFSGESAEALAKADARLRRMSRCNDIKWLIATVSGRFYAMDRDKNWHRTEKAEQAIFECKGKICKNRKPSQILKELYDNGIIDEHLEPLVFFDDTGQGYSIEKNDGVFIFNYRPDRVRQLSQKILDRKKTHNLFFVTMTEYDKSLEATVAFPDSNIDDSLASVISQQGLTQSHIAETEKYAHVTYFFNGGREEPHEKEHHFLIDSRRDIATHDQAPEMRAREIADKAVERIEAGDNFLVINFANADMVGHTANREAIITAVETVDRELKRVCDAVISKNGIAIVTADHGNAEVNVDAETGEKHTAHTLNLVPLIVIPASEPGSRSIEKLRPSGTLADIAPTILQLMQIKKPASMTGKSLIYT